MPTPFQATTPPPSAPSALPAPAAPTLPAVAGQLAPIEALRVQAQVLADQLTVLISQRRGLETQLRMIRGGPERGGLQTEIRQLNSQIAKTTGDLESVRAQIDARTGVTTVPSPVRTWPPQQRQFDPDLAAGLMFAFIFAVLMPISIAYARRIWRGKPRDAAPRMDDLSAPRLERLEQAVDSIAIEIERISEGQRFVTKVLAERMPVGRAPVEDAADASRRALGAGPIEPVRVAERQTVRQVVTPH